MWWSALAGADAPLQPFVEPLVAAGSGVVAALMGALAGAWLTHRFGVETARAVARATARQRLAGLYVLLWPPTRYAALLAALDALDADLAAAEVPERLRVALARVAAECWADGAMSAAQSPDEPGISTKLLQAYRRVRAEILLQLAPRRRRMPRRRTTQTLAQVHRLIAANRMDRERRFVDVTRTRTHEVTVDNDKEAASP